MTAVISRAEAKKQGLPRYFTGKPCKHGHVSERATHNGLCLECKREQSRESYASASEKKIASVDRWRRDNLEKKRSTNARWRADNRDWQRTYDAQPHRKKARAEWERANGWSVNQRAAARRLRLREASVELTQHQRQQINQVYRLRDQLTMQTGVEFHVDHYIPVSKGGKHVPENLWVIPAEQNRRKCAKLIEVAKIA